MSQKLLYISCHSVLEHQELTLFNEIGIDVFSMGAYSDPKGHDGLHRPGIPGLKHYPEYQKISREYPRTNLPQDFIDKFDVIMVMHDPNVLVANWQKMKHKKVIWRSIGQSVPSIERLLKPLKDDGLLIVRYSPKEKNIPNYIGETEMIRFYEDPADLSGWNGNNKMVINITQSLMGRGEFCHYKDIIEIMSGFDSKVFGNDNDNLGPLNGGQLTYDLLKGQLRDNRVFVYGGTYPASYTLSFMEAFMTGIPIVAIGNNRAQSVGEKFDFYEIPNLIDHGKTGFVSDNISELKGYVKQLLDNDELAHRISNNARAKAIEIFGKSTIQGQWTEFFNKIKNGKL